LRELPPADLSVILTHESEHLRRGDDWTNLIQKIVRALFFFHPAVWWIENRLSVEREMACDDAVLAVTSNPRGYANCLVSLLEKSLAHRLENQRLENQRWSMAQSAVNRAREASLRLAQILDKNRPVATRIWTPALAMVGIFSLVCFTVLPQAPQVVAFDRGATSGGSDHTYAASLDQPSRRQTAAVVPALLRTGESLSAESSPNVAIKTPTSKVVRAHTASGRKPAPQTLTARLNEAPLNETPKTPQIVAVSANGDQEGAPEFQTLVFIQTIQATQFVNSDVSVWKVQVWRILLVSPGNMRSAEVPVAHSI
jgi:hypothetical protein